MKQFEPLHYRAAQDPPRTRHPIMSTEKKSIFVTDDGKNLIFTFLLVSSLFLLWGVCNGMIDAMDKHFQTELNLSKSQSAWVQFAHYLGYFLMAMPAGWLASKLGYKGGIIAGSAHGCGGRLLVHSRRMDQRLDPSGPAGRITNHCLRRVFERGLRHCRRTDISGNDCQPLYDGPRITAICRHAHQPGPILERRRLDFWAGPCQHILLWQGCRGQQHRE